MTDPSRKYCTSAEGSHGFACNFCNFTLKGGGITRFKYHLSGTDPQKNVKKCDKCPVEVREEMKLLLSETHKKKKEKQNMYKVIKNELLENLQVVSDNDDDIKYNHDFLRAIKRSREESSRISSGGVGGSLSSPEVPTTSQSLYNPGSLKQKQITEMLNVDVKQKLGRLVSKILIYEDVAANKDKSHHLKNMMIEAQETGYTSQFESVGSEATDNIDNACKKIEGQSSYSEIVGSRNMSQVTSSRRLKLGTGIPSRPGGPSSSTARLRKRPRAEDSGATLSTTIQAIDVEEGRLRQSTSPPFTAGVTDATHDSLVGWSSDGGRFAHLFRAFETEMTEATTNKVSGSSANEALHASILCSMEALLYQAHLLKEQNQGITMKSAELEIKRLKSEAAALVEDRDELWSRKREVEENLKTSQAETDATKEAFAKSEEEVAGLKADLKVLKSMLEKSEEARAAAEARVIDREKSEAEVLMYSF